MDNAEMIKYVDMNDALNRVRGNKKLYFRMMKMFKASTEFAALEEAIGNKDYVNAERFAHSIKGITGNLSLHLLFETSSKLMNELKQNTYDEKTYSDYQEALKLTLIYTEDVLSTLEKELA